MSIMHHVVSIVRSHMPFLFISHNQVVGRLFASERAAPSTSREGIAGTLLAATVSALVAKVCLKDAHALVPAHYR